MQVGVILAVVVPNDYASCGALGYLSHGLRLLNYAAMTGSVAAQTQGVIYFTLPDCAVIASSLRRVIYTDETLV